ncbi:hypothetical protein NQ314_018506 [Rhamnusium bicolor]|uniref:SWIM-type domain-containing protein n=1 Tax=Rhamnusium bicolor TaxID=1586634 RepID=A0AAV8WSY5_9CUCU|nr:hypothetical protein NQ314_018506 [Rhamnusium bicolor]
MFLFNRKKNYGSGSVQSTFDIIKNKIETYKEKGIVVSVQENPMAICILTPVMKRVHNYEFAAETVFVDSTASCDESGASITFFIAGSMIGGIPLGCVIHNGQSEEDYWHAFNAISSFGGKGAPNVFMTDDSTPERKDLSEFFDSSRLLLCTFLVCQAVWRWLWDKKHDIEQLNRKSLMLIVRQILCETDITNCNELIDVALKDDLIIKYPQFKSYFEAIIERKSEWCIAYRQNCLTRGRNTNNLVEASIRVFKDVVLKRCRAFNPVALAEFVINVLETHHQKRIQKFASFRVSKPELEFKKFCTKANDLIVKKISYNLFHVSSAENENIVYGVHSELNLCECPTGIGGAFCKHLCAVHIQYGTQISTSPALSFEDRIIFAKIALGNDIDETFFQNMSAVEVTSNNKAGISAEVTDFLVPMMQNKEIENETVSTLINYYFL